MLTRLSIRNIVLIEALDLDFAAGLGVLTGETGAGKSILLDALGLVLGNRAEALLLRAGEDVASVTASFEFDRLPHAVRELLHESGLEVEPGEPLILKRRLKAGGADAGVASKAFVNDQPVGAALLRELAGHLVELHGQHDDRGLVNPRGHRLLLDRFAAHAEAGADTAGVDTAWRGWRLAQEALDTARAAASTTSSPRPAKAPSREPRCICWTAQDARKKSRGCCRARK
jgi:DNA repair protein RecN (Recombination protein N)